MNKISIDYSTPTPYLEEERKLSNIKRYLTYRFAFRLIGKFKKKNKVKTILEIGTGSGYFLKFCSRKFPNALLYGIEYDERLYRVTKNRVKTSECYCINAENFDLVFKNFDVIVSNQVIEHLYSPESMIRSVKNHLDSDGIFLLTTPNLSGLGAKTMKSSWQGYRNDHVSLKTYDQWNSLMIREGFEPLYLGSTFFSGIRLMNKFPLGIFNWGLLLIFGCMKWKYGESVVGVFKKNKG